MTRAGRVGDMALGILLAAAIALPFLGSKNAEPPRAAQPTAAKVQPPASAARHHKSHTAQLKVHRTQPSVSTPPAVSTTATTAPPPTTTVVARVPTRTTPTE